MSVDSNPLTLSRFLLTQSCKQELARDPGFTLLMSSIQLACKTISQVRHAFFATHWCCCRPTTHVCASLTSVWCLANVALQKNHATSLLCVLQAVRKAGITGLYGLDGSVNETGDQVRFQRRVPNNFVVVGMVCPSTVKVHTVFLRDVHFNR